MFIYVYVYICIHTCMYMYIYICIYIYTWKLVICLWLLRLQSLVLAGNCLRPALGICLFVDVKPVKNDNPAIVMKREQCCKHDE